MITGVIPEHKACQRAREGNQARQRRAVKDVAGGCVGRSGTKLQLVAGQGRPDVCLKKQEVSWGVVGISGPAGGRTIMQHCITGERMQVRRGLPPTKPGEKRLPLWWRLLSSIAPTLLRGNASGDAPASRFSRVANAAGSASSAASGAGRRTRPGISIPTREHGDDAC